MQRWCCVVVVALAVAAGCKKDDGNDDGGTAQGVVDAGLGATGGQCVVECTTPADCCDGPQCGISVFNYSCQQGTCHQLGCIADDDCAPGRCATLGTFGVCGRGCRVAEDCCPPVPPGVTFPDGGNTATVTLDGGVTATFYRCGAYPQRFICTGTDVAPDDAGTTGICLRVCGAEADCPGVPIPVDGGFTHLRPADGGMLAIPLADGGAMRLFAQTCVMMFPGVGQCYPGCAVDADCCPDPTGISCQGLGARKVCVQGACVTDGCRSSSECGGGTCQRVAPTP